MSIREILESYDKITIDQEIVDGIFIFSLFGKQYLYIAPLEDNPSAMAVIFLYNDDGSDIPHIMLKEETFPGVDCIPQGKYRPVCLYEQESIVGAIMPYDAKVRDAIERLIELLSMNEIEKEREFQKEFMFYWNGNSDSHNTHNVYLDQNDSFSEFDVYYGNKSVRLVKRGIQLSDIDDRDKKGRIWTHHVENNAYYIPITDKRGILPPYRGHNWTTQTIKDIVYSEQIEHIDQHTFQVLKNTFPNTQNIIIVFGMELEKIHISFAVKIKCKNIRNHSLLEKIVDDTIDIEQLFTIRKDYYYLCEQIGNDCGLLGKNVLLIGGGSLGSYIAFELVKNGASNLKIYDGDNLEDVNVLRWAYGGIGKGSNKAIALTTMLKSIHPEINIVGINKNINQDSLLIELSFADMIVITVGSSNEQLNINRILVEAGCSIPVIYIWLEEGGINSHILFADYRHAGCFECLYTDIDGNLVNNRARKNTLSISETSIIRNGCGGTRASYGTAVLLRTTSVLLDTIHKFYDGQITQNVLIDISPNCVKISDTPFPMRECNCCGNKKDQSMY